MTDDDDDVTDDDDELDDEVDDDEDDDSSGVVPRRVLKWQQYTTSDDRVNAWYSSVSSEPVPFNCNARPLYEPTLPTTVVA